MKTIYFFTLSTFIFLHNNFLLSQSLDSNFRAIKPDSLNLKTIRNSIIKINSSDSINKYAKKISVDMFIAGQEDASIYYKGYKTAARWSFYFPIPLIPILTSMSKPKLVNLNYPSPDLIKNSDYLRGYKKRAHRIKARKVISSYLTITIPIIFIYYGFASY